MFRLSSVLLLVLAVSLPAVAFAQYPVPYDAFQAGSDAARRYDAKQRQAIALQLRTIDQMKWYSAVGASGFGVEYYRNPPSLDYVYGTGRWSTYNGYGPEPPASQDIFLPWPYVPGDIWGYRWNATVRQPIGRREFQTGPNRWESHPVYADELRPTPPGTLVEEPSSEPPAAEAMPARPSRPRQF